MPTPLPYACCVLAFPLLSLACQKGAASHTATPFGRDLDRICNVMKRADSPNDPVAANPTVITARWLAANLESPEGRNFSIDLARLNGAAKLAALRTAAQRVGLATCPTADLWAIDLKGT